MPYFRPRPVLTILMLAALVTLVLLGNWQMDRLAWKLDLIDQVAARTELPPVPLGEALQSAPLGELSYRPVTLTGTFDHAQEIHVFGRNLDGYVGYFIFTPLHRAGGDTVIVNRGFVLQSQKDVSTREAGQAEGEVTVTGLLRLPDLGGWLTPAANPDRNEWFARDVDAMAAHMGLSDYAPFYVDALEGEVPQGGQTFMEFRNDHFGYAMTWYALAIVMLGVYIALHVSSGRLGFRKQGQES